MQQQKGKKKINCSSSVFFKCFLKNLTNIKRCYNMSQVTVSVTFLTNFNEIIHTCQRSTIEIDTRFYPGKLTWTKTDFLRRFILRNVYIISLSQSLAQFFNIIILEMSQIRLGCFEKCLSVEIFRFLYSSFFKVFWVLHLSYPMHTTNSYL